jgi:hypothetical protein
MHVEAKSVFALEPQRAATGDPYFRVANTIEKFTVFCYRGTHLLISADEQAA